MGLIHMNGRVYDPQLGRFLSADPFIQFADNSQSYSRYSYVLNNPLSSTDPSGHFAFLPVLINVAVTMASEAGAEAIAWNIAATTAISTTEMAVIQTAIQAGLSGLAQGIAAEAMGGTFAQGFEAGVLSGVQSGIYDGIGGAESLNGTQIPGLGKGITVERVLAHGLVGGAFARARGDSFESGFASGVFSKLTAGRIQENISNKYGGAAASAMIGGTASVIAGGKFANGAVSGAFGYLYNQCGDGGCFTTAEERNVLEQEGFAAYYEKACGNGDLNACRFYGIATGEEPGPKAILRGRLLEKGYSFDQVNQLVDKTIPNNLAKEYADLLPKNEANAEFPSYNAIKRYHWDEFGKYGLDKSTFGGTPFGNRVWLPKLWAPLSVP